jgi:hypothetical protein
MRVEDAAASECPNCKAPLAALAATAAPPQAAAAPAPPGLTAPPAASAAIPFEAEPGIGSFFATLKGMIASPLQTIRGQKTGEGIEAAVAFWLIIQIPVQFLNAFLQWGIHHFLPHQPSPQLPPNIPPFLRQLVEFSQMLQQGSLMLQLGLAAAAIIFGVIWLFIFAGLTHGFLRLFGGGSQGYKTTVKAFCYAVAPGIFILLPCCGGCVAGVWILVLNLLLVGPAHREEIGKGAGAYLCALFISCLCIGALWFVGGAALFAMIASRAG